MCLCVHLPPWQLTNKSLCISRLLFGKSIKQLLEFLDYMRHSNYKIIEIISNDKALTLFYLTILDENVLLHKIVKHQELNYRIESKVICVITRQSRIRLQSFRTTFFQLVITIRPSTKKLIFSGFTCNKHCMK